MSKNTMPSLAALLGLLAIAGYQNRDKIGELLKGATGGAQPGGSEGGLLGSAVKSVTDMFGGQAPDVKGGISDVVDKFRNAGHGSAADSWVGTGANADVTPDQTASALGPDIIDALVKQTGLTRDELLKRLSQILPQAVDTMTPGGKFAS
ncbi:YidB family protein [Aestuariivirga sp.]|uniref:YidB family protein n=1 Tax=Aestuariivirga sp. TaxID=2650926 RepID=UPI0039E634C1